MRKIEVSEAQKVRGGICFFGIPQLILGLGTPWSVNYAIGIANAYSCWNS